VAMRNAAWCVGWSRVWSVGLLGVCILASVPSAWGEAEVSCVTAAPDVAAQAQAHYVRGKSFYESGDFEAAQHEFAEALRLSAPPRSAASPQGALPAVDPVAVVEAPLFLTPEGAVMTDIRELSRYRERVQGMLRDLSDRIRGLAHRELRAQRRWLEHGRDAEAEREAAEWQSKRRGLEQEQQRLEQLLHLVTRRMAVLYYNQGVEASGRERFGEAVKAFEMAAELDPSDTDVQYNLGVALASKKQYRKAAEAFESSLRLRPDDAEAHYNLAVLYDRHLKRPGAVREHLEAYVRLASDAEDHGVVKGWLNVLGRRPSAERE